MEMQDLIKELNALTALSKERPLTEEEQVKRQALREEYLEKFRGSFQKQLDNIDLVDKKGNVIKPLSDLKKKVS